MNNGWIALHRKLLDWEWWDDHNTTRLFLYLLLKANHEDKRWKGVLVKRGQLITGLHSLKKATGISVQSLRTSLDRLISTNEITKQSTSKFTLITICRYGDYQDKDSKVTKQSTGKLTNDQQATNKQLTTNNNYNNITIKQNKNISIKTDMELKVRFFESFWAMYPRKISKLKSKEKYLKILKSNKTPEKIHITILEGLKRHLPIWEKTETKFIPHATTWLNGERWNDDVNEKIQSKPKRQNYFMGEEETKEALKDLF